MNEAVSCGDLVARSLDGATCETSSEDINGWAQTCCVDKTSICPVVAQLCKNEDPANFLADAMYEYRCSAYSGTEAFTEASCPEGCHAGEDDKARDQAYRFYCSCPASSYDECVQKLPGPEDKGPLLNHGSYCSELVARSLDGATCETRSEEMTRWAQTCCVDKTSLCPTAPTLVDTPTVVGTPQLGGSGNKTRDCVGSDASTCGCDYASGEQTVCPMGNCGCFSCPHEFPRMEEIYMGSSGGVVCFEECPEESTFMRQVTRTPANLSTVNPEYMTPESFPAPTDGVAALSKPMPEGKECWEGGSEYVGYHWQVCTYTSGTQEQMGQTCTKGSDGCECLCMGCPVSHQEGPATVESQDGSMTHLCFEKCADGASRRCTEWMRSDSCRCYPNPEAGRLVHGSQLKCCTPDGGDCSDISRVVVASDEISSIEMPDSSSCESLGIPSSWRCWHSEDQRACAQEEAGCECRCYSCDNADYPLPESTSGDPRCYAECPVDYQLRCDNYEDGGACACYSCGNSAEATTEPRGVQSVFVAECPAVGNLVIAEHHGKAVCYECGAPGASRVEDSWTDGIMQKVCVIDTVQCYSCPEGTYFENKWDYGISQLGCWSYAATGLRKIKEQHTPPMRPTTRHTPNVVSRHLIPSLIKRHTLPSSPRSVPPSLTKPRTLPSFVKHARPVSKTHIKQVHKHKRTHTRYHALSFSDTHHVTSPLPSGCTHTTIGVHTPLYAHQHRKTQATIHFVYTHSLSLAHTCLRGQALRSRHVMDTSPRNSHLRETDAACPEIVRNGADEIREVKIINNCDQPENRWEIHMTMVDGLDLDYTYRGECSCDAGSPNCNVRRFVKGLYEQHGTCSGKAELNVGTECADAADEQWKKQADEDCAAALGCDAICEVSPACSEGGCCHDYHRCVPRDYSSGGCSAMSYASSDTTPQGLEHSCNSYLGHGSGGETTGISDAWQCSGALIHPNWVLAPAECVADGYHETGIVHVALGTVNNCLEEHTSSTVIFHPGYQLPTGGSNAALIKLEYPSKHAPVQLYHTGTVGFESCDGSSRLLQVKPRLQDTGDPSPASIESVQALELGECSNFYEAMTTQGLSHRFMCTKGNARTSTHTHEILNSPPCRENGIKMQCCDTHLRGENQNGIAKTVCCIILTKDPKISATTPLLHVFQIQQRVNKQRQRWVGNIRERRP
eukprot:Tamp_00233.p1 GENE.Tamp_00233~~Tamp_00233.p1  ORF type:complete len:1186 (+),score=94.99 Tamp_00233:3741-7298(+)